MYSLDSNKSIYYLVVSKIIRIFASELNQTQHESNYLHSYIVNHRASNER